MEFSQQNAAYPKWKYVIGYKTDNHKYSITLPPDNIKMHSTSSTLTTQTKYHIILNIHPKQ